MQQIGKENKIDTHSRFDWDEDDSTAYSHGKQSVSDSGDTALVLNDEDGVISVDESPRTYSSTWDFTMAQIPNGAIGIDVFNSLAHFYAILARIYNRTWWREELSSAVITRKCFSLWFQNRRTEKVYEEIWERWKGNVRVEGGGERDRRERKLRVKRVV